MVWGVVAAAVLVVVLVGIVVVRSYQRFGRQRTLVRESWRQVEVELARRHELVPELVRLARAYAGQAQASDAGSAPEAADAIFDQVQRGLAAASEGTADLAGLAEREAELSAALRDLYTAVEDDPRAKVDHEFLAVQQRIAETEDRIAAGRRFYNANVTAYNTRVDRFPSRWVAANAGFARSEPFEVADDQVQVTPPVDPTGLTGGTTAGLDTAPDTDAADAPEPEQDPGPASGAESDQALPPGDEKSAGTAPA